jgi:LacI family transcriptional regulator
MALATLQVARSLGISVPRDLSLISFDNTPLVHFTQPPMTAVDQPIAATTSKAVELIIAAQKGEPPPSALTVVSATIFERDSVAPPPDAASA